MVKNFSYVMEENVGKYTYENAYNNVQNREKHYGIKRYHIGLDLVQ